MSFPGRLLLSPRHFLRRSAPPAFSCPHSLRFHSSRSDHSTSSSVDQTTKTTPISSSTSSLQAPQEPSAEDVERPKPPPYLPRPLGVNDPPTTRPPTEQEKLAKLVDEQARLQERKHLISEVSRGYYHDWNQLRHNGNKLWTAPPSLIQDQVSAPIHNFLPTNNKRKKRALFFPNISGVALSNKETKHTTDIFADKVSILAVESTRMSEVSEPSFRTRTKLTNRSEINTKIMLKEHTRSFYGEPLRMLSEESHLQLVRLNVQENRLKSWLVSLFINNLRKTVPARQHATYILTNQSLEYVREPLGMVNKLLGYVYLVDSNMKVRWAGCGFSNADEVAALFSGTRTLLHRLKENNK
ncbi:hypothetical protein VP01_382g1 [Puccinia sorghi]|uniref:Mitochondrial ATPase complex subunit ATP10 n=1 Tax=Puccinia sorghi TaxID=27349 RepID=A0A0L6UTC1_9BASI|nr:hypothetical protein VP01_382g1 [Puccinia sorghi]